MEILFRGKRVDNGEWVYGMLCNVFKDRELELELAIQVSDEFEMLAYPVIPETVGQDTGLKDKNGQRIFEGDIVACGDCKVPTLIEWHDESHSYLAYNLKRKEYHRLDKYFICYIGEIIKNIHDNPELME